MHQTKKADLLEEIHQLEDRTLPKYIEQVKKLELIQDNLIIENNKWRDREIERIESEYIKVKTNALEEFDVRKSELTETLIAELKKEKEKSEQYNLTTEALEPFDEKPAIARRLRKRQNNIVELVPVPQVKRHKPPVVPKIQYMLHENEIDCDIKAIQDLSLTSKSPMPSTIAISTVKKNDTVNSSTIKISGVFPSLSLSSGNLIPKNGQDAETGVSSTIVDTRIEGGKLLFEKIWYHRGQPVFIEGKQIAKFPAVITAIQNECIWVKKTLDESKFLISLSDLTQGEMSIKRRAVI